MMIVQSNYWHGNDSIHQHTGATMLKSRQETGTTKYATHFIWARICQKWMTWNSWCLRPMYWKALNANLLLTGLLGCVMSLRSQLWQFILCWAGLLPTFSTQVNFLWNSGLLAGVLLTLYTDIHDGVVQCNWCKKNRFWFELLSWRGSFTAVLEHYHSRQCGI